jgi:hypothetical protein
MVFPIITNVIHIIYRMQYYGIKSGLTVHCLQGFKKQALAVSSDPEHKFELALQLGELTAALELARDAGSHHKWRQLADLALARGHLELAQECLTNAQDYGGLLLLATSSGMLVIC